jgi:cytochrome c553
MKTTLILSLGLVVAAAAAAAMADDDAPFVWSRASLDLIAAGDPGRGEEIAGKVRCSKCHGETGVSEDDFTPSIAGQVRAYAYKQLVDFKTGVRESSDMKKAVRKLSNQDMADLAAYFAMQTPEPPAVTEPIPQLVAFGDESRLLLPCAVCHGEKGEGWGDQVPSLAGQKIDHLVETMTAYQTGDRANDEFARMRFIAGQLTPDEIHAVAVYYAAARVEDEDAE